jgi:thioredoxin 2
VALERIVKRICKSCGNLHEGHPQELVEGAQCKRCKAPFRTLSEPLPVDKANFDAIRGGLQVPILVDIEIPGTPEERSQRIHLDRVARKLDGRGIVVTIDADNDRELAWELGVQSVPTLLVIQKGHTIFTWEGPADAPLLEEWMRQAYRM